MLNGSDTYKHDFCAKNYVCAYRSLPGPLVVALTRTPLEGLFSKVIDREATELGMRMEWNYVKWCCHCLFENSGSHLPIGFLLPVEEIELLPEMLNWEECMGNAAQKSWKIIEAHGDQVSHLCFRSRKLSFNIYPMETVLHAL